MPRLLEIGHEIVAGAIGVGKTLRIIYNVIMSLIHGRPCAYLDPKGDGYLTLLAFLATTDQGRELWELRRDRILFLNPVSTSAHAMGFNAIAPLPRFSRADPDRVALLANSLVSHIREQSGFEMYDANRMQNIMAAALGLLVDGGQGEYTLDQLPKLFLPAPATKGSAAPAHNAFVRHLLAQATHAGTRRFWEEQWRIWTSHARGEWTQSTLGRIFPYLFDEQARLSVCTVDNGALDLQRVVNDGYWLFVNLPYALLSDTVTTTLGNLLISRILYAAMQRRLDAPPYRLILDEARFFNSGPLTTILETSRAYNLWLTLVVQSVDQLCRSHQGRVDERLKEAVLGLCRYFSVFHDPQDAETFARLMFPVTGLVPTGVRASGDWDYLPTAAEEEEHRWRFLRLRHREMVFYDKLGNEPPRVWRTPEVIMDPPDEEIVAAFEDAHLRRTGRPLAQMRAEVDERAAQVERAFFQVGRDRKSVV